MDYIETEHFSIKTTYKPSAVVDLLVEAYRSLQDGRSDLDNTEAGELLNQMIQHVRAQDSIPHPPTEVQESQNVLDTLSTLHNAVQHTEENSQELQFKNSSLQQQLDRANHRVSTLQQKLSDTTAASTLLMEKLRDSVDNRTAFLQSEQSVRILQEQTAKQQQQIRELEEALAAERQYIRYFQQESQAALQSVKEDAKKTQDQALELIDQLRKQVLTYEKE